jgi:transcriptional regulator with PAS, ATPase and Fis domain
MQATSMNIPRGYRLSADQTLSTLSSSYEPVESSGTRAEELILLLECDRPLASSVRHRLTGVGEVIIGRGTTRHHERAASRLHLRVPDARISTVHALIRRDGDALIVQDARSKNGLVVNGARVAEHRLNDGDVLECGRTFWRFRDHVWRPSDEPDDVDYEQATGESGMLTFYEPLAALLRSLTEMARAAVPILILGASGTGKELIAQAVHAQSGRPGAFVGINCGALPEHIVEAELFGARRGAFTGAIDDRLGLVRASHAGTLFLDEIGELSPRAQPTLLRVLQEREVLPIGTTQPLPVDLRLVAATHRDLGALVEQHRFRADLLARISGFVVQLPTLRQRIDDLGIIIAALLKRHASATAPTTLSIEAMRRLLAYEWPLNVRELEHCLRAALPLAQARIDVEHLPAAVREAGSRPPSTPPPVVPALVRLTAEQHAHRQELCALLVEHRGNVSEVARRMSKDPAQIRRWIRRYAIAIDDIRSDGVT